jgi:epoxyqueuosine reductase QueG
MKDLVKSIVIENGADVCGVAEISRFGEFPTGFSPLDVWAGCRSVVSFGMAIPKGLSQVDSRLIYGHFNEEAAVIVDRISMACAKKIERELECKVVPIPCDTPYDFWDEETMTGKGILSMRHVAVQCGLGTIGKSSLLLNPRFGNHLVLGAFLTDLDMESDPYSEDICLPNCCLCVDKCPVHAISEKHITQSLCRPNAFGRAKRGFGTVECNNCRMVCPMRFGKKPDKDPFWG